MNRSDWLTDDLIEEAFERRAGHTAPVELRDEIVALTAATGQRASWRLRLASAWSTPVLRPAWVALLVLGVLLGAALALMLVGGPDPEPLRQQADPRQRADANVDATPQISQGPQESQGPQVAHPGLLAYTQDGDVYMANPDGSGATMVVHDPGVAFSAPTWSPDARWLALRGGEGLFLLDAGTLALRRLGDGGGAVWSPDSQSLAFVPTSEFGADVIAIFEVGTGAVRELHARLQPGQSVALPLAWSPDARWFLAPANAGDGKRFVRIDAATGEAVDIAPMYHLAEPGANWSPDSRRFAYARPDDCGGNPPCQSSIVVEDADLTNAVAITDPAKLSTGPVWSPDGAWIAFSSATLVPSRTAPGRGRQFRRPRCPSFALTAATSTRWSKSRPTGRPSPGTPMPAPWTSGTWTNPKGWASGCPKSGSATGRAEQSPRRRTPVAMTGNQSPGSGPSPTVPNRP